MRTLLPLSLHNTTHKGGGNRTCGGCHLCVREPRLEPPDGFLYAPEHLVIEITNQCNLDCIMCERRLVQPDDLMPWDTYITTLRKLAYGVKCVELSGLGEPTLAPLFPEMVRKVYAYGKILYFPTNGAGLMKPAVLAALGDDDNTRVSVSIDAATPETYGYVRRDKRGAPGNWNQLIEVIRQFRRARPGCRLTSTFVAGGYNVNEFPAFVELAAELGFTEVAFRWVRCWGIPLEPNSLRFRKEQTERAIAQAVEKGERLGVRLNVERKPYADGFENAGGMEGVVAYLDIVPLDVLECDATEGTTEASLGSDTLIDPEWIEFDDQPPGSAHTYVAPAKERQRIRHTRNVMQVLTDGTITTCGAKHPIGHVAQHDFLAVIRNKAYQAHLRARAEGRPLESQFCRGCEKMF